MENSGVGYYFDADEIVELLDYFEDMDDFDHYGKVVKIGQKLHPHNTDIKIRNCKAHFYNNEFEKALASIEQLCDTEDEDLMLLKCECLCALDRYSELIAYLEALPITSDEEVQERYEYLAQMLHEQYDSKNAYDLVKRGLALFPDSITLKEELCYHLDMQGEMEQAIEVCKELIDYDPYSDDYWYILGRLYAITEVYDKAIEAFDFALVCDETDLEIKLLKTFCYFMQENLEKVIEVYRDIFPEETYLITELIQPYMHISNDLELAYVLLKKMIEKFDNSETNSALRFLFEYRDDEEANGLLDIADCFPCSLLFLLFKELLFMAEGQQGAIQNIEQIIQMIYEKGANNANFRLDAQSKFCMSSKQKIEKLFEIQTPDLASDEK
jgi:tetratricopeptide (TPR) repeat protein